MSGGPAWATSGKTRTKKSAATGRRRENDDVVFMMNVESVPWMPAELEAFARSRNFYLRDDDKHDRASITRTAKVFSIREHFRLRIFAWPAAAPIALA
jgi:hypothetical protein